MGNVASINLEQKIQEINKERRMNSRMNWKGVWIISEITLRNITNHIGELKFVVLSERSQLAMKNKFNDRPTGNTPMVK